MPAFKDRLGMYLATTKVRLAGLVVMFLAVAGAGSLPVAARQDCVGYKVIASGQPVIFTDPDREEKARENAIAAWEYLAARQAGDDHATWPHADFRKIDCWLPDRSHTQCMAIGQPCTAPEEKKRNGKQDPAGD